MTESGCVPDGGHREEEQRAGSEVTPLQEVPGPGHVRSIGRRRDIPTQGGPQSFGDGRALVVVQHLARELGIEGDRRDRGVSVRSEVAGVQARHEGGKELALADGPGGVTAHGGLIDFESEPGRTTFRALLPIAPHDTPRIRS